MATKLKVAYVSVDDPLNVHSWSGLPYYIARSLQEAGFEIEYVWPLREKWSWFYKARHAWYKFIRHQKYARNFEPGIARNLAKQVARHLRQHPVDFVFSTSTVPIAYLDCPQPIVTWCDAIWPAMVDFYFPATGTCSRSLRQGLALDRQAVQRTSLAVYCSQWAAQAAISQCGADPARVKVVPYGANIETSHSLQNIQAMIAGRPKNVCRLLFMGVDWKRKGGDTAVAVAEELNRRGLKTELVVVGCEPQFTGAKPDWLIPLGFISKSTPEGRRRIDELFAGSHFLILPTRAEAYGLVFCEANSFGVPCIATNVGGTPTIIRNGINGQCFNPDA